MADPSAVVLYDERTGAPVVVPASALSSVGVPDEEQVFVKTPGGFRRVPASRLDDTLGSNPSWRLPTEREMRGREFAREARTLAGGTEAALQGLGSGLTAGFGEPLVVGLSGALHGESPERAAERAAAYRESKAGKAGDVVGLGASLLVPELLAGRVGRGARAAEALAGAGEAEKGLFAAERLTAPTAARAADAPTAAEVLAQAPRRAPMPAPRPRPTAFTGAESLADAEAALEVPRPSVLSPEGSEAIAANQTTPTTFDVALPSATEEFALAPEGAYVARARQRAGLEPFTGSAFEPRGLAESALTGTSQAARRAALSRELGLAPETASFGERALADVGAAPDLATGARPLSEVGSVEGFGARSLEAEYPSRSIALRDGVIGDGAALERNAFETPPVYEPMELGGLPEWMRDGRRVAGSPAEFLGGEAMSPTGQRLLEAVPAGEPIEIAGSPQWFASRMERAPFVPHPEEFVTAEGLPLVGDVPNVMAGGAPRAVPPAGVTGGPIRTGLDVASLNAGPVAGFTNAATAAGRRSLADAGLARAVAREAGIGAAFGMGHEVSEATLGDRPITVQKLLAAGVGGGLLGGTAGAGLHLGGRLAGAALDAAVARIGGEAGEGGLKRAIDTFARSQIGKAAGGNQGWMKRAEGNVVGGWNAVTDELINGKYVGWTTSMPEAAERIEAGLDRWNGVLDGLVKEAHAADVAVPKRTLKDIAWDAGEGAYRDVPPLAINENGKPIPGVYDTSAPRELWNRVAAPGREAQFHAITGWIRQVEEAYPHLDAIPLDEVRKLRTALQDSSYKGANPLNSENLAVLERRKIRRGLEEAWIEAADKAVGNVEAGAETAEFRKAYEEAKQHVHRLIFADEMVQGGLQRINGNRIFSITDYGIGAGAFAKLGPKGLALMAANKVMRERGPAFLGNLALKLHTLDGLGAAAQGVESAITAAAENIGRGVVRGTEQLVLHAKSHHETPEQTFKRVGQQALMYERNPGAMAANMSESMRHLAADAPMLVGDVAAAHKAIMDEVIAQMPKPPPTVAFFGDEGWRPSDTELDRFQGVVQQAEAPLTFLHDAERGVFRPEVAAMARKLNAPLFDEATQKVMHEVMRARLRGERPEHVVEVGLSQLLGRPMTASVTKEQGSATVAAYASLRPQPSEPAGGGGPKGAAATGRSSRTQSVRAVSEAQRENRAARATADQQIQQGE